MLSSKYPISLHVSCLNECKAQNFGEVVLSLNRYQQLSTLLGRPNFQRIMYFYLIRRKDNIIIGMLHSLILCYLSYLQHQYKPASLLIPHIDGQIAIQLISNQRTDG